jgi:2-hydroxychromene-2-carboxylate isomerase
MNWTIPNLLSVIRVVAAPCIAISFVVFERPEADQIAVLIFIGAAATDYLDGWLARILRQESAFGRMLDPIGPPVERAFSLFPWATRKGRGVELLGAFLRAAFANRIDTSREAGLRHVVEAAGLSWDEAKTHLGDASWRELLEANRKTMYEELGLWGVPSYRVRGPEGTANFSTWGQDRLWLVAQQLRERIARARGAREKGGGG